MDRKITIVLVVVAVVVIGAIAATVMLRSSNSGSVSYITKAPQDMRAALAAGEVDAYIAWEPYVSDSVVDGVGEVLLWSDEIMPNHPCCVVAVSNEFLETDDGQELTERFLRAHIEANIWMAAALSDTDGENYSLLLEIATGFTARSEAVVEAAMNHLKFGYEMDENFQSALEEFTQMYLDTGVIAAEKLEDRGYDSVSDFVDQYIDESFLEAAMDVEPSETLLNPDTPVRLGFLLGDIHQLAQAVAKDSRILGDKSLFEEYGVNVETAPGAPFANGGAEMLGFAAGNVDIGYLGSPPALQHHLNTGVDTRIIAQANSEGSGIVVAAGSGIDSLEDLVNKTVATPGESSIQFLLLKIALEREGLDLKLKT